MIVLLALIVIAIPLFVIGVVVTIRCDRAIKRLEQVESERRRV